ncbi:MAG: hypothetical protein AUK47_22250 [Deltaproteobacteria bacterium CG2_30_63_29]|nr:MAG: hypothetical protein AUK47_22250 [Deltaproteobacteria bacterium CG2_30_63_29]
MDAVFIGHIWAIVATSWDDLVNLRVAGKQPAGASRPWLQIQAVTRGDEPEHVTLLLPMDRRRPSGFGIPAQEVTLEEHAVLVGERRFELRSQSSAPSLVEALPLRPQESPKVDAALVCFDSLECLGRAAHHCLRLERDQLTVARLDQTNAAPVSASLFFLKVVQPSVFLLEKWREAGRKIYLSPSGDPATPFWVELGYEHPWQDWLSKPKSESDLILVAEEGWQRLTAHFEPVFEHIDLSFTHEDVDWEPTRAAFRFDVPVHLGHRGEPVAAGLWVLDSQAGSRLEGLLQVLSPSELDNLQLATVKGPHGDLFVVREALVGRSKQDLPFGQGYASVIGLPNLFIPVDRRIEPPLPRERLRRLFHLVPGQLTVVSPGRGTVAASISRIDEGRFAPLSSLVEYLVHSASDRILPLIEGSILDLGRFALLPSRPDQVAPIELPQVSSSSEEVPEEQPEAVVPKAVALPDGPSGDEGERTVAPKPDKKRPEDSLSSGRQEALMKALDEAENLAAENIGLAPPWMQLASLQAEAGLTDRALETSAHAVWISRRAEDREGSALQFSSLLAQAEGPARVVFEAMQLARRADEDPIRFAGRLSNLVKRSRDLEGELSKRMRWFLWRALLAHSHDSIEAERVREEILRDLSLNGIDEKDAFPFVRRHVRRQFEQRTLPEIAHTLLDRLTEGAALVTKRTSRVQARGALAAAWAAAGKSEPLELLVEELSGPDTLPKGTAALAYATCAAAMAREGRVGARETFEWALGHLRDMPNGYEKDQVIVAVLDQIHFASLLGAELELGQAVLDLIVRQEAKWRCWQLKDCAELLVELVGAQPVLDALLQLLDDPEIVADAYFLELVLMSLTECQAGRPPSGPTINRVVDTLIGASEFDESAARALDVLLASGEVEVLNRIAASSSARSGLSAVMMESCLIRGRALWGQVDEGLALLGSRLDSVWSLGKGEWVTAGLRRLIPNTAHFGRPETGLRLIHAVVERLGASEGLSARDRGHLLSFCAAAAGRMGAHSSALELLERIVDSFASLIEGQTQGVSYLFEVLGLVVEQVIQHGTTERGVALVNRGVALVTERMTKTFGIDHPYFLHQAHIKCALALLSLEQFERGVQLLRTAAEDIARVRVFDAKDRIDLCLEGVRAMALLPFDERSRVDLLITLVDSALSGERTGQTADDHRVEVISGTVREMLRRESAARLALIKVRAKEERLIRDRVLEVPLLPEVHS